MLSPGSATALVNDALEWLRPGVMQSLQTSLSSPQHASQGVSESAWQRAVGTTPAMFCSALAAVLNFLGAHITARQVWLLGAMSAC